MIVADSMTAVLVFGSHHHKAWQGRWAASIVLTLWDFAFSNPLMTAPKPSPPSVIGSKSNESCGRALRQPRAMAFAAPGAESVPLNLSGMIKTCRGICEVKG